MAGKKNRNRHTKKERPGKGKMRQNREEMVGKVLMTREGYAFITYNGKDDIFVSSRKLRGALHGDTVKVLYSTKKLRGERNEGEVTEIIERSKKSHIGILQITGNEAWVITTGKNMPYDIRVNVKETDKEYNGYKVAALVDDWPRSSFEPLGHIVDILGKPGENDTEMHAILSEFGLPFKFEPKVEREADKISDKITEEDIKSRRDFRGITTFTIDPSDAKDFDDALSIRETTPDSWEVGVHIADVTHYIKQGSIIDKEAYNRGTSVYLVDRTVPMLPEKLSNQLCSLRPNEDKLCFSAIFELDEKARVKKRWFGRTVINSRHRFDYGEVQNVIKTSTGPLSKEILKLNQLAEILRNERFEKGAIGFERPEMKIEVDDNGKPIGILQKVSVESNWLIEEFMLLANREVARLIGAKVNSKSSKTFVYRVHEEPNTDKVEAFHIFIKHLGYKMKKTSSARELSSEINSLFTKVKGRPEEGAIEIMALRSMARAHYTTDNVGHYGLAFDYYTHFTSPIRRYPDMMVHRMLTHYLNNGKSLDKTSYEDKCKYSSEREQLAADAERASIKYKMIEYMQDKIGNIYQGSVSGITEWGMYVELDGNKVEGMIPLKDIKEDYFVFDEESYSLTGKRSKKRFTLGSLVKVKVVRANLEQKQLDYELLWDKEWNS